MSPLSVESMTDLIAPLGEPQRSKVRDYIRKLENRLALAESALKADERPLLQCTACGRKSWTDAERGQFCNMPQPNNRVCSGIMQPYGATA